MNDYLSRTLSIFRNDVIYSPLAEDAEILDSPKKVSTPSNNLKLKFLKAGRRLFQHNKTFKIDIRDSDEKYKKGRIRTLLSDFQSKVQTWSQEIRNSLQQNQKECITPNCVTPNRKIQCMLGRTPEKLYSPFSIETPPDNFLRSKFSSRSEHHFQSSHWRTMSQRRSPFPHY